MLSHSVCIGKRIATQVEEVGTTCSLQVFTKRSLVRDPYIAPWKLKAQFKNHRSSPALSFCKWGGDCGNFKGFVTGLLINNGRIQDSNPKLTMWTAPSATLCFLPAWPLLGSWGWESLALNLDCIALTNNYMKLFLGTPCLCPGRGKK